MLAHKSAGMAEGADFFLRTPTSYRPKILGIERSKPFLKRVKFQGAGSILNVDFAWSNRPHLHRGY